VGLGSNGFRRRLSGDQFAARDRRIWRMRADGFTIEQIANTEGIRLATTDEYLKDWPASSTTSTNPREGAVQTGWGHRLILGVLGGSGFGDQRLEFASREPL
jgi:hypothetical protein